MTIEVVDGLQGRVQIERETGARWVDDTNGQVSVSTIEPVVRRLGREIANWMQGNDPRGRRGGGPTMINRQAYAAPGTPYEIMRTAYLAVENDDVVGGVADVTEGLMFQGLKFETEDIHEADVFNQLATDLDLDTFARQWHREEFTYSQSVVGFWWGPVSYTPRTKTVGTLETNADGTPKIDPLTGKQARKGGGKKSKKKMTIWAPRALTLLDPRKVVPLQPGPFGQDRLAWQAGQDEYAAYMASWQTGAFADALMREFFNGPVNISEVERQYLKSIGVEPRYLIALNPDTVVRLCRTKAHYERFPVVRLKRIFADLDLKQHLMEADRVTLVGAANYILLVRQGSKEEPAKQEEIDNLQENFKVIAKVPIVTGDHRLSIDIITPSQDQTLNGQKYDTLDRRIISSALGALTVASSGQRNESTLTIARGVGRLLESRRQMFRRFVEREVCKKVVEHPRNEGLFDSEPNLAFTPREIQLDDSDAFVNAVLSLRSQRELSRQSTLETFGFDQAVEAMHLEIESEQYDDTFQTHVPFDGQNPNQKPGQPGQQPGAEGQGEPSQVSGARGGRPAGGGDPPQRPPANASK